jgi:hypothetical protein
MDNALSTLKNIYLHKQKYFISSLFSSGGTFFYMVAMVNAIKDNSMWSIIAMCLATFLGSYIPAMIIEKREGDKLYVYDITTNSFEEGIEFSNTIRNMNIPIKTNTIYNEKKEKVIGAKVFCNTKAESSLVKELITDYKYHAYVAQEW